MTPPPVPTPETQDVCEPTYLYSFGSKRHIQDPGYKPGTPFCDHWQPPRFQTEQERETWHRTWSRMDGTDAAVLMAADRAMPVCKRCEKAWNKR